MDGRYTCSLVAEVVRLTCGVDALADFMVLGGTGEVERSSTGPRAWSWCGWHVKSVSNSPLGQGGRPASAGECTARPSAHSAGMESETKAREAPLSLIHIRRCRRIEKCIVLLAPAY